MRSTKKLIADLAQVNEWLKEVKNGAKISIETDTLRRAFNFAKCEIERRLSAGGDAALMVTFSELMDADTDKKEPKHECTCGGHVGEKLARMTTEAPTWKRMYEDLDRYKADLLKQITNLKTDLQSARDTNTHNATVIDSYRGQVSELLEQRDESKAEIAQLKQDAEKEGITISILGRAAIDYKAEIVKLRGQQGASQVRIVKLTNELEALRKMMQPKSEEAQVSYGHFETPEDCKARLAELEKAAAEKYDRTHKAYDAGVETLAQLHHASMLYSHAAKQHRTIANLLKQRNERHVGHYTAVRTNSIAVGALRSQLSDIENAIIEFVLGVAPKKRESESKTLNGPRFTLTDKCREETEPIAPAPQQPSEIRDPLKYAEETSGVLRMDGETVDEYFKRIGFPNGIRLPYTTCVAKYPKDLI